VAGAEQRQAGHDLNERRHPERHGHAEPAEGRGPDAHRGPPQDQRGGRQHERQGPGVERALEQEGTQRRLGGPAPVIRHEQAEGVHRGEVHVDRLAAPVAEVGRQPEQLDERDEGGSGERGAAHHAPGERDQRPQDALPASLPEAQRQEGHGREQQVEARLGVAA
jgi:hypothetical protein